MAEEVQCCVCGNRVPAGRPMLACPHCGRAAHSWCMRRRAEETGVCPVCGQPVGIRDGQLTGEGSGLLSGPSTLDWAARTKLPEESLRAERVSRAVLGPFVALDGRRRRRGNR